MGSPGGLTGDDKPPDLPPIAPELALRRLLSAFEGILQEDDYLHERGISPVDLPLDSRAGIRDAIEGCLEVHEILTARHSIVNRLIEWQSTIMEETDIVAFVRRCIRYRPSIEQFISEFSLQPEGAVDLTDDESPLANPRQIVTARVQKASARRKRSHKP